MYLARNPRSLMNPTVSRFLKIDHNTAVLIAGKDRLVRLENERKRPPEPRFASYVPKWKLTKKGVNKVY